MTDLQQLLPILRTGHGRLLGHAWHWRALIAMRLGRYGALQTVDWTRVDRLVFLCAGNICRSAYANAFASRRGLVTTSAGLYATDNDPAWPTMVEVARARAVDLMNHRARRISRELLTTQDLVVAFEPTHVKALSERLISAEFGYQITLLGLFIDPPMPFIQDPYALGRLYATTCAARIEQGVDAIAVRMRPLRQAAV